MNVTIVGFDFKFVEKISKKIADELGLQFVNPETEFNKFLLGTKHSMLVENEILQIKETELIQECSKKKNVVLAIPNDMFISNNNYIYLKNNCVIFISSEKINNLQKNIKKILKNVINFEINQEKINFNEILNNIRGYYDR